MCSTSDDDDDRLSPAAVRQELIQRIKNGEGSSVASDSKFARLFDRVRESEESSSSSHIQSSELLPPAEVGGYDGTDPPRVISDGYSETARVNDGLEIERPRSALHAGDFSLNSSQPPKPPCCQHEQPNAFPGPQDLGPLGSSPATPWYIPIRRQRPPALPSQPATPTPSSPLNKQALPAPLSSQSSAAIPISAGSRSESRSRALSSLSYSSSFILTTPTSPLVRETRNDDVEPSSLDLWDSPDKAHRPHASSPQTFQALTSRNLRTFSTPAQIARRPPSVLREGMASCQGHQARRSLTSGLPYTAHSNPHTPPQGSSRRPSLSSDASPSLRASMVGSYEESILRGRMSTTPSKPLDFTAQIGALGKGDCKPKHPPHASVDFPAVYYDYNSGTDRSSRIDNEPSPYVGFIDLERSLPPVQLKERRRSRQDSSKAETEEPEDAPASSPRHMPEGPKYRPPAKPKAPAGGSYRIPQQGQLQILIKSPSKTAVKLFLVPYDLSGMEPGTKTFVRQRCYSTGPVIENPITSKPPSSEPSLASSSPRNPGKPSLRYLIQLNICCPSRGRFFLYKSIHVVFANRVPDNKERLQNEILWPDPRYTPYKAACETSLPGSASLSDPIVDRAQRRRSYGGPSAGPLGFSPTHGSQAHMQCERVHVSSPVPPVPPLPSEYCPRERGALFESPGLRSAGTDLEMSDPISSGTDSQATKRTLASPQHSLDGVDDSDMQRSPVDIFSKRSRDDDRLGGVFGRPGTPEPGEGLLARRLRGFGIETEKSSRDPDAELL